MSTANPTANMAAMLAGNALRFADEDALVFEERRWTHAQLDEDVNAYLRSWKIPENEFTREKKVTLRLLLTHQAGLPAAPFRTDDWPGVTARCGRSKVTLCPARSLSASSSSSRSATRSRSTTPARTTWASARRRSQPAMRPSGPITNSARLSSLRVASCAS